MLHFFCLQGMKKIIYINIIVIYSTLTVKYGGVALCSATESFHKYFTHCIS